MQEAEIMGIVVSGQPRQEKFMRLHFNGRKLGVVACACHPKMKCKIGLQSRPAWGKK
jgi:hypothetical protein